MSITWSRDEIILACAIVKKHSWRGLDATHQDVVDLSTLLQAAPIHPIDERDAKFRNANGVARKTWDIATQHPHYTGVKTRGNRLDGLVLREFIAEPVRMDTAAQAIRTVILSGEVGELPTDETESEEIEVDEGRLLIAWHLKRERSPRLRKAKIAQVKKQGKPIACEVCGFDFGHRYGPLGLDYIEVHDVLPLHASGPTKTRLQDLALLCSNCHRMIHRARPWLTPAALRGRLT